MPGRYADSDPYTYQDSSILINIPDLRAEEELVRFERIQVTKRSLTDPPPGNFDYAHFKTLHRHLFQDVYTWAGEERSVPISKGGHLFATPAFIARNAEKLFQQLHDENLLRTLDAASFAERAAHYVTELNVLHPFRDGNGRTLRYFLMLLAEQAGYDLDPAVLQRGWMTACVSGFDGEETPMRLLLFEALRPLALAP
ncbi:Fic/DOC family protein [Paucidesulfovibrio longus]|uniref:Fic/DOC family protein n=1 Tax=Paucidesulfovibrio longus TaxID=889 RepID=UPI0003B39983|nr:Fic family protein [Paucidesulfovibrio longus]